MASLHPDPSGFIVLESQIEHAQAAVVEFFIERFAGSALLGDPVDAHRVDYLVVLACKDLEVMVGRVEAAAELINDGNPGTLLLCGGGFDVAHTEVDFMSDLLAERGRLDPSRLVREESSIDTIGNAVFGKLELMLAGRLAPTGDLLVVTTDFHALRSLAVFRRVFGEAYRVAALPVPFAGDDQRHRSLAAHELKSDGRASREIFALPDPADLAGGVVPVTAGDETTLLFQLLINHDFYRHRYDIMRRFAPVLAGADGSRGGG